MPMTNETQTTINATTLEQYCQRVPDCRRFLENFFGTCESYDVETNRANYRADLEQYRDRPYIRKHYNTLLRAFDEIASIATGVRP